MQAFEDWYRRSHPGLARLIARAVGDREVASDAADEAFARAFRDWDAVGSMAAPGGWVYRVALNEARRQLRRRALEVERVSFGPTVVEPPGGESWSAVETLPLRQRTAVSLRHLLGLTEAEIAGAMGVTRSTVSSTLASAYRKLAVSLTDTDQGATSTVDLTLAIARSCRADGCTVADVATDGTLDASWSDAVRDTIKVRPGDLVAVDRAATPPQVVWRWWRGDVVGVTSADQVHVRRNVTQREPDDPRTGSSDVAVPAELAGSIAEGDAVWFGSVGIVAVAGRAIEPDLDAVRRRLQ